MNDKKWHEDIPDGGVLCKSSSGNVHLITSISGRYKDATTPSGNTYDVRNLTPLTAAEWWDFAPWQDMDSAPINQPMLIIASGQVQVGIFALNADGELHLFNNDDVLAYTQDCEKWLPLPQVSK